MNKKSAGRLINKSPEALRKMFLTLKSKRNMEFTCGKSLEKKLVGLKIFNRFFKLSEKSQQSIILEYYNLGLCFQKYLFESSNFLYICNKKNRRKKVRGCFTFSLKGKRLAKISVYSEFFCLPALERQRFIKPTFTIADAVCTDEDKEVFKRIKKALGKKRRRK